MLWEALAALELERWHQNLVTHVVNNVSLDESSLDFRLSFGTELARHLELLCAGGHH